MPPKTPTGKKAGARKVDAESYIPPAGDWEDPKLIFDFEDGWTICEALTEYDRRLMAKLTLTCVSSLIPLCDPSPSKEEEVRSFLAALEAKGFNESQRENALANFEADLKYRPKVKPYKFLFVKDPEGRPFACVLMVKKEVADDPTKARGLSYTNSDDLGQGTPIELDGTEYVVSEVRLGTGKTAPMHAEERVIQWYQAVTGTWNEESYLLRQTSRRPYGAWLAEQDTDLTPYRRQEVAA